MKPIMLIQNGKLVSESKIFFESLSVEYKVPEDRETRIYDFYTLALYDSLLKHKETVKTGLLKPGWDEDTVADLQAYVHDGMESITQELKTDLLDATALSVSAELRHAFDREENHEAVFETVGEKLSPKLRKFYINLIHQKALYKTVRKSPKWAKREIQWREKGQTSDYTIAKNAFDKSQMTYQELSEVGARVFVMHIWPPSYGGEPWKNICLGLAKLDSAKGTNEVVAAVDHILDLEHNTGVMLNKVKRFMKNGGFAWIKNALDFKFKASPWELAQKSSISSAVIGRLNRLTGADTDLESFQNKSKSPKIKNAKKTFANTTTNGDFSEKVIWEAVKESMVPYTRAIGKTISAGSKFLIDNEGNVALEEAIYKKFFWGEDYQKFLAVLDALAKSNKVVSVSFGSGTYIHRLHIFSKMDFPVSEKVFDVMKRFMLDKGTNKLSVIWKDCPDIWVDKIIKSDKKFSSIFDSVEEGIEAVKSTVKRSTKENQETTSVDGTKYYYFYSDDVSEHGLKGPFKTSEEAWSSLKNYYGGDYTFGFLKIDSDKDFGLSVTIQLDDGGFLPKNSRIFSYLANNFPIKDSSYQLRLELGEVTGMPNNPFSAIKHLSYWIKNQNSLVSAIKEFYGNMKSGSVKDASSADGESITVKKDREKPKIVSEDEVYEVKGNGDFDDWAHEDDEHPESLYLSTESKSNGNVYVNVMIRKNEFPFENKKAIEKTAGLISKFNYNNPSGSCTFSMKMVDSDGSSSPMDRKTLELKTKELKNVPFLISVMKQMFCQLDLRPVKDS